MQAMRVRRAPEQQRVGADRLDDERGEARAGHAAEHDAAPDEPEEPLCLPRIVDAVGERPELADDKDPEQIAPDEEADRHPIGPGRPGPEQRPEREHDERPSRPV